VTRPLGTSKLHQRQRLRPLGPLERPSRIAQPPVIVRCVLKSSIYLYRLFIGKRASKGTTRGLAASILPGTVTAWYG